MWRHENLRREFLNINLLTYHGRVQVEYFSLKKMGAKPNVVVNQYQAKIEVFQAEVVNLSTGALDNFKKWVKGNY